MDFSLTDEQVLLRETARAMLTKECPTSLLRAHMDDPAVADKLWVHLRDWVELADGPLVDMCLFLEECGAVLLPGPFFPTALARMLIPGQEGTATVVPTDLDPFVHTLEADRVDTLIAIGHDGMAITNARTVQQVPTLDTTRRCFTVDVVAGQRRAADTDGWIERATVALAADMLGTARALLERSIAYAKERVQFDVPIGSFQAIQHKLADVAVELERATAAVYYAAMCIDADDPDRHRAAHVAKAAAGAAATKAAKDGMQVHGGIGYTWEHDLHLFIRRAYLSEHLFGTRSWHHDRLADLLF
jgi:alkylation response protein AidB-like acyl-CoA dehydrogenase